MRKKSFQEKTIVEREQQLWEASKQYIRGNINVNKFEDEEYLHEENFRRANYTFLKRQSLEKLFLYFLIAAIIVLVLIGIILFAFTKSQFSWLLPASSVYLIRVLLDVRNMEENHFDRH